MRCAPLVVLCLIAGLARADGKIFGTGVPVIDTPDQRAVLWYRDGVERLAIETTYAASDAKELAWVVPLPNAPTRIEPVSPDVFRTLEIVFAREVVFGASKGWVPALLLFLLICGLALLDVVKSRLIRLTAATVFTLFVLAFMFPFLVPRGASQAPGVGVVARERVGSYDVATLQAREPRALLDWLRENGFDVAPDAESVIAAYVDEGWVFAAGRLVSASGQPHPVMFEFESERAVYPLRLTGAGNGELDFDLYVFGRERAACDRLEVAYCCEVHEESKRRYTQFPPYGSPRIPLAHEGLRHVASGATVMTKLSGTLSPVEMDRDLEIAWEEYAPFNAPTYTARAALDRAVTAGSWSALLALAGLGLLVAIRRLGKVEGRRWWQLRSDEVRLGRTATIRIVGAALVIGLAVGAVRHTLAEVVDVEISRGLQHRHVRKMHSGFAWEVSESDSTLEEIRRKAREFWAGENNPFTGAPVREATTPGDYRIEVRDGKVVYIHHDALGAPH